MSPSPPQRKSLPISTQTLCADKDDRRGATCANKEKHRFAGSEEVPALYTLVLGPFAKSLLLYFCDVMGFCMAGTMDQLCRGFAGDRDHPANVPQVFPYEKAYDSIKPSLIHHQCANAR
jgi:hypothetical protein